MGMGQSDAKFRITVLAAFSLTLPLHSFCSSLWAFSEVPRRRSSSAMALLGLGRGPQDKLGLGRGYTFFGPTIAPQKPAARILVGKEGFDNVGPTS